jgi:outer membrane protein assembly factor BamB
VVYVGSPEGNVYALNAKTGAKLWSYTTPNPVGSSPVVANGMVYIGSDDDKVYTFGLK